MIFSFIGIFGVFFHLIGGGILRVVSVWRCWLWPADSGAVPPPPFSAAVFSAFRFMFHQAKCGRSPAGVSLRSATLAPLPNRRSGGSGGRHALYVLLRASMLLPPPPRGIEPPTGVGPAALWWDAPQVPLVLRVEGGQVWWGGAVLGAMGTIRTC